MPRNAPSMMVAMIAAARRTIIVAYRSKFGRIGFAMVAALDRIDVLVTDAEPPEKLAKASQTRRHDGYWRGLRRQAQDANSRRIRSVSVPMAGTAGTIFSASSRAAGRGISIVLPPGKAIVMRRRAG